MYPVLSRVVSLLSTMSDHLQLRSEVLSLALIRFDESSGGSPLREYRMMTISHGSDRCAEGSAGDGFVEQIG